MKREKKWRREKQHALLPPKKNNMLKAQDLNNFLLGTKRTSQQQQLSYLQSFH